MITDTSFIPLDNPDLSTFDPSTIGIDPDNTTEVIQARSQPLVFDYVTDTLKLNKAAIFATGTFGDEDLITPLPNPNLDNQLVAPSLQVGGSIMATDIILGSGVTKLISHNTGTYIYNNLNVTGNISNNDSANKLNSKVSNADFSVLSDNVSSKADQTFLITNYYNKNESDSLLQGKVNSNNVYSISHIDFSLSQKANTTDLINKANINDVYSRNDADLACQTKADMLNYPTFDNIADLDTTIASLSTMYQSIENMSSYVTSGSLAAYVTTGYVSNTLTSYLTSSGASHLYQSKGSFVSTNTRNKVGQANILTTNPQLSISASNAGNEASLAFLEVLVNLLL